MLKPRERVVLETLLPSGAHPRLPFGLADTAFDRFLAEFEDVAAPEFKFAFRVALFVGVWLAPVLIWRLPPLSRHSQTTRERALIAMMESRWYVLRQLVVVLKTVACMGYGADAQVRQALLAGSSLHASEAPVG